MMPSRHFRVAKAQWQGQRAGQEDTCNFLPLGTEPDVNGSTVYEGASDRMLAVLADGMGGHVGGQRASTVACDAFLTHFTASETTGDDLRARLEAASEHSNGLIAQETARKPELKGMGCTLVGVYLQGDDLHWVSVGDSILCLYRKAHGQIFRLNEDHSMAPVLRQAVTLGELSEDEARNHPHRNALRSALTGGRISLRDAQAGAIELGDCIVVASDGLLTLASDEIKHAIEVNLPFGPQRVAQALIDATKAKGRPDQDNTSVVVIDLIDASADPTLRLSSTRIKAKPVNRVALASLAAAGLIALCLAALFLLPPGPRTDSAGATNSGTGTSATGGTSSGAAATTETGANRTAATPRTMDGPANATAVKGPDSGNQSAPAGAATSSFPPSGPPASGAAPPAPGASNPDPPKPEAKPDGKTDGKSGTKTGRSN
jgi:PPM family protein phosphatase